MNTPTTPSPQSMLLDAHVRRLRLPVVLAQYPKVAQEAAQQGLTFDAFLLLLVEQELAQRDENMQRRRIAGAKFPSIKTLDQYDFSLVPQLNRQLVLELAQGGYLTNKENIHGRFASARARSAPASASGRRTSSARSPRSPPRCRPWRRWSAWRSRR